MWVRTIRGSVSHKYPEGGYNDGENSLSFGRAEKSLDLRNHDQYTEAQSEVQTNT